MSLGKRRFVNARREENQLPRIVYPTVSMIVCTIRMRTYFTLSHVSFLFFALTIIVRTTSFSVEAIR